MTEALSESDLPYKADVIDLRSVDPGFRAIIEADMIALPFGCQTMIFGER